MTRRAKKTVTTLPIGTTTSPLPTDITTAPASPPAPTTTSVALALTAPPVVNIPLTPSGFVPVDLNDYRGSHPKAGQLTVVPFVITELANSTSYEATFGPAAPPSSKLVSELTIPSQWTAMRVAVEEFLVYTKSLEAITWKSALADLDTVNALFQIIQKQNASLTAAFPELAKMLDVTKVIAQRSRASRVRNAKSKAKAAAAAKAGAEATLPATPSAVAK